MFKVTGISTLNGKTKVRFANDLVSRVKILVKDGHQDINLIELAEPLSKADCVKYLKTTDLYQTPAFAAAIDAADLAVLTQAQLNAMSQEQWNAISAANRTAIVAGGRTAPY